MFDICTQHTATTHCNNTLQHCNTALQQNEWYSTLWNNAHETFLNSTAYCIWSVISPRSKLNRFSSFRRLFCYVPLERDQLEWHSRMSLNDTPNAISCASPATQREMTWHNVEWYDTMWNDMTQCEILQHNVKRHNTLWNTTTNLEMIQHIVKQCSHDIVKCYTSHNTLCNNTTHSEMTHRILK